MNALLAACPDGDCHGAQDVLDRVCGVRDCADIRLFWYTDLEAAKAAARAAGKPILSLRLMGRLDEEFSCANSRFFRTVFYKNREINQLLRDHYILHWRSVRPVPRVTIDFGDGSHLERTLSRQQHPLHPRQPRTPAGAAARALRTRRLPGRPGRGGAGGDANGRASGRRAIQELDDRAPGKRADVSTRRPSTVTSRPPTPRPPRGRPGRHWPTFPGRSFQATPGALTDWIDSEAA